MKTVISSLVLSFILFACGSAPEPAAVEEAIEIVEVDHLDMGREISAIAQAELMKSVKEGLSVSGPAHAIKHCNIHATPLTDSLSGQFNCVIQRISAKNRNPGNAPKTTQEKLLLNTFLETSLEGSELKDTLMEENGNTIYYRPILIASEACLKCHGQLKTDIDDETLTALYGLYPADKATNYRLGEFRGAWKITFN